MSDIENNESKEFNQFNESNEFNGSNVSNESYAVYSVDQKKKTPVWLFVLIGFVVIAGGCAALVAFVPSLRNSFDLLTMSPASYYSKVETGNMDRNIDKFTDDMKESALKSDKDQSMDFNETVAYGDLLQKMLSSGSDESSFTLKEIGVSGKLNKKAKRMGMNTTITYGGNKLSNLDIYTDENKVIYARIPEISESYVSFSLNDIVKSLMGLTKDSGNAVIDDSVNAAEDVLNNFSNSEVDYELLNAILKHYSKLIITHMDEVATEKNVVLSDNYLNAKTTKVTVSLSEKDAYEIVMAVMEEIQTDTELYNFINKIYPITQAQYDSSVSLALKELKETDTADLSEDKSFQMVVWVNMSGKIIGRGFYYEGTSLTWHRIIDKTNASIKAELHIAGDSGSEDTSLLLEGLLKYNNKSFSGNLALSLTSDNENVDLGEVVLNNYRYVSATDYDLDMSIIIKKSAIEAMSGGSGLPEEFSGDIQLNIKSGINNNQMNVDYSYGIGSPDNLIKMHMDASLLEAEDVILPSESYRLPEDLEKYLDTVKPEEFIRNIGKAFDVPDDQIEQAIEEFNKDGINSIKERLIPGDDFTVMPDDVTVMPDDGSSESLPSDDGIIPDYEGSGGGDYPDGSIPTVNQVPKEPPVSADQLPEGVELDEYGYYSYYLPEEAVRAAKIEDDNPHFDVDRKNMEPELISIISKFVGNDAAVVSSNSSNMVFGSIGEGYNSQLFTFVTTECISNNDNSYKNYISLGYDTGSNRVEDIRITMENREDCDDAFKQVVKLLEPGFKNEDMKKIKKDIEDSDFGSVNYKSLNIFFYSTGDSYNSYSISPLR